MKNEIQIAKLVMSKTIAEVTPQVYDRIQNKILNFEIKFGGRINVKSLCEEFHVSSTPVREAIKKLTEDGLIRNIPRKGYYVYSPTAEDVQEIYELRTMIECYVLSSKKNITRDVGSFKKLKEKIKYLRKQGDKKKKNEFIKTESIHPLIVSQVNNQRIRNIYNGVHKYTLLFQHIIQHGEIGEIDGYLKDHLDLVNSILNDDLGKAETIVVEHNSTAAGNICRLLKYF